MGASEKGHLDVVRELCNRGANVNAASTDDGFTALMFASMGSHVDVAKCLLESSASKATLTCGFSAFDFVSGSNSDILRVLLTLE